MKERSAFERLLETTILPSNISQDERDLLMGRMLDATHTLLPKKLYRYQRCDDLRFDSFDKDQIWISTARSMNDGYDTRIFVREDEIKNEISNNILSDKTLQGFKDMALKVSC